MLPVSYFFTSLAFNAPTLILPGIGVVLAITMRRRLGSAMPLTVLAFLLMVVDELVGIVQLVILSFTDRGPVNYVAILSVPRTLLMVAGWVLLLVAIFRRRDTGSAVSAAAPPPWAPPAGSIGSPPAPSTDSVQPSAAPSTGSVPPVRPAAPPADPARPPAGPGQTSAGPADPSAGSASTPPPRPYGVPGSPPAL